MHGILENARGVSNKGGDKGGPKHCNNHQTYYMRSDIVSWAYLCLPADTVSRPEGAEQV